LADYRDSWAELHALGARLVAVSVDEPVRSAALRQTLGLPFSLLCDPQREVVQRWGLLNAHEKGGIAYPAVFVLDRERVVRFRSLDRLASRVSSAGVLAFLRGELPAGAPRRSPVLPGLLALWQSLLNLLRFGVRSPRSQPREERVEPCTELDGGVAGGGGGGDLDEAWVTTCG
jgi:hypothetical protein